MAKPIMISDELYNLLKKDEERQKLYSSYKK